MTPHIAARGRALFPLAALVVLAALALAAPARADFGVAPEPCSSDDAIWATDTSPCFSSTLASTQAGAHADQTVRFRLAPEDPSWTPPPPPWQPGDSYPSGWPVVAPDGSVKTIKVDLPVGLAGNPQTIPHCRTAELNHNACPVASQVGVATMLLGTQGAGFPSSFAVYNLVPDHGHTAEFGFKVLIPSVHIVVRVRDDGDYGLTTTIANVTSLIPVLGSSLTFWGVPADPSHDTERGDCVGPDFGTGEPCTEPAQAPVRPFMSSPTVCGGPLTTTFQADSWENPGAFTAPVRSASPAITGCDRLTFDPAVSVRPDSAQASAPTGITVDVTVPQRTDNPAALQTPNLKDASVTLPEGIALSPSAADGLQSCSAAQFGVGSAGPVGCPLASTLGESEIVSPLLAEPLKGSIYLGQQLSGAPYTTPLYVVAEGAGVRARIVGTVRADPATGRLTTTFQDQPPLPFSLFRLHFRGGPRAIMALGPTCATTSAPSVLASSGGQTVTTSSSLTVASGCAGAGFAPTFAAGATNPVAGADSPFVLSAGRSDADQELRTIDVTLPPGLLGRVGRVPLCADAQAAAGACGAESRVGSVTALSGPGTNPYQLPGAAYMTGPYKGAPYGLAFVVPARTGPIDLGLVVVRAAVHVDPTDARLRVISDPLPTILGGIPLRMRSIRVLLDRPGFMLNPTSCNAMRVAGRIDSQQGLAAAVGSRFQVADCRQLRVTPRLKVRFTGRSQNRDGRHPGLKARLKQRNAGRANLKKVAVKLPLSVALDPDNAEALCTPEQAAAKRCPANTVVGKASARTPLLSRPLSGKVYFVQGIRRTATGQTRRTLPKLWVALRGDIALDVWASSSVSRGKLVTTFPTVPDAPLSRFDLKITGGKHGILVANTNTCRAAKRAGLVFRGHNGKRVKRSAKIAVAGCKKRR